ncbi:MAG: glycosyltransferase family 39 protein [Lachnospiraceae bacterium]|nr:glycosyltransferase family 39 protein [Lachnospiraceae bacterium]
MKLKIKIADYFSDRLNRYRFFSLLCFILIITAVAWQSDDAYHAYVMAKHLVEGNGFVYNIGERASASSCPLFTLVIACGYFVVRNMFFISLFICIAFSAAAYGIICRHFCHNIRQVLFLFLAMITSVSFMSYTTSGLENSLLFFLAALFFKNYYAYEDFDGRQLFYMGLLISLIALTRMDAVLMFVPAVVYIYIGRRKLVSFGRAVLIGFLSLLPFFLWELFSLFYYGFPFPNTAYVKLGTDIALREYLYRGLQYLLTSALCDPVLIVFIAFVIVTAFLLKKGRLIFTALGLLLYLIYLFYIGGDFMLGRHFTTAFLISLITVLYINENGFEADYKNRRFRFTVAGLLLGCMVFSATMGLITSQFLYGHENSSPIADERAGYFRYTSLYNNILSLIRTGDLCIRDAWNEQGIEEYRACGLKGGILPMVPGISIYYNSDMYLNDWYALGDPFLSKLPAEKEENWRIGHMYRKPPEGYEDTAAFGENVIENEALHEYYDVIRLITRGELFDPVRIRAVIDINLGKYDHLIDEYESTLK